MMEKDMEAMGLAEAVKGVFKEKCGEFRAEDFVAVAELLGFYAHKKTVPEERLKSVAESYFPDIIGRIWSMVWRVCVGDPCAHDRGGQNCVGLLGPKKE